MRRRSPEGHSLREPLAAKVVKVKPVATRVPEESAVSHARRKCRRRRGLTIGDATPPDATPNESRSPKPGNFGEDAHPAPECLHSKSFQQLFVRKTQKLGA